MCGGLQHPLAAANEHQERPRPFVVPVTGEWFGGNVGEIGRNLQRQSAEKLKPKLGTGLK